MLTTRLNFCRSGYQMGSNLLQMRMCALEIVCVLYWRLGIFCLFQSTGGIRYKNRVIFLATANSVVKWLVKEVF